MNILYFLVLCSDCFGGKYQLLNTALVNKIRIQCLNR
jgi:hypothetical protein